MADLEPLIRELTDIRDALRDPELRKLRPILDAHSIDRAINALNATRTPRQ